MKKTTMQEIADALGISRVSVWKVFNGHPGVSPALQQKVLLKSKELGYPLPNSARLTSLPVSVLPEGKFHARKTAATFSVVVSRPESSVFWVNIIHVVARELSSRGINLMYTYVPSRYSEAFALPDSLTNGTVQGIIVLNVYDRQIMAALNALPLPKVFLDTVPSLPPDQLNGDLLLLSGETEIQEITAHLISKGLKRIGFIGDIDYALTNRLRFNGYLAALKAAGRAPDPEICLTHSIGINSYAEEIHAFLQGLYKMPEAFVCVSDYVAYFVLQYLNEKNIRMPEQLFLSGFDGISDFMGRNDSLTTVPIAFEPLGRRLVRQLRYRIANPDYPYEIIHLRFKAAFRSSTGDTEPV